jgi:hypothetical protein
MHPDAVGDPIVLTPVDPALSGGTVRLRGLAVAVPCVVVLALAATLTPRKAGHGTHERLGLPPCEFLQRTGYPCPSCGMTTAFAAMAHGQVALALRSHPFGALLSLAVAVLAVTGLGELLVGRPLLGHLRPGVWWAVVVSIGLLAGWAYKLAAGLAGGSLPLR